MIMSEGKWEKDPTASFFFLPFLLSTEESTSDRAASAAWGAHVQRRGGSSRALGGVGRRIAGIGASPCAAESREHWVAELAGICHAAGSREQVRTQEAALGCTVERHEMVLVQETIKNIIK